MDPIVLGVGIALFVAAGLFALTKPGQIAPDTRPPRLLHGHKGGRSAIATKLLRRQGYTPVYNPGSFGRTKQIIES